jgi:hypothetical protein
MWQPIETAPKDGTAILLWAPYYAWSVWQGCWSGTGWIVPNPVIGDDLSVAGHLPLGGYPTHWQPLPPPPTTPAGG